LSVSLYVSSLINSPYGPYDINLYTIYSQGEVAFCADSVDAYTYLHRSHQTEEALCSVGKIPLLQGPEYQRAFALPVSSPFTSAINFG